MHTATPFVFVTPANTTPVQLGGASEAAKVAGFSINNTSTTLGLFVHFWWDGQTGLAPTPGTTLAHITLSVAGAAAAPAVGYLSGSYANPVSNPGKLWMWVTAGSAAPTDTTAPAAGAGVISVYIN